MQHTKAEAALTYAQMGWSVIPVVPNGKIPATSHGVKDATKDPVQIMRWWNQNPDFNIGIAAGEKSGIIVFDIDPRNGGEDTWDKWVKENGQVPDGPMQMTAGGGNHYIAEYDKEIRSCKLVDGVDLLADGRYFVAYPSTIEGRSYEWEASSDPFDGIIPFTVPSAWKKAYETMKNTVSSAKKAATENSGLIQGGRNNGLTAMGGAMRNFGMTKAEILAAISVANETRCEIPLPASEVLQIANSVARYEPDSDIAASVALGSEAAEALLGSLLQTESEDYFATRATSFLSQPSPPEWCVKKWVPQGVTMVYGESGVGKTFFTLDIACHMAAQMNWNGLRTKSGYVLYMCGEGNYGMRQRIASWCKLNNTSNLDNLLISNKAIDLDDPTSAAKIIRAVREITEEDVVAIFIDTVNNHMSGDENSARDTRNMINSANVVASALDASIIFNHHKGHSNDASGRARGSSAWKASLDSSIMLSHESNGLIEVSCTKMKDYEEPNKIYGRLESVPLGWFDEDGEEIKGAVFKIENNPIIEQKESKKDPVVKWKQEFERAWFASGAELFNGNPIVSRDALVRFLVSNLGLSETTAANHVKPSGDKGRMIKELIGCGFVKKETLGFVVIDDIYASGMLLKRKTS